ncbi:Poly(A)-specific ribonuclease PARN [Camponotus floridanus]|uniref:Poly(A)-specific ribonuclease PARN n=1 Tax=Camponotus floridanus TaxID=104421 RepID=E2AZW9_CAMFO|nr:poly(A)-specific ribonuclease PARN [Camponotus floridanus]EFN61018.1 Poly(A)-specific ribonuclease PARN [Camponotus floridanus]
MEVTCLNFQDVLSELDSIIQNATFLSIDGEFTGLNSGPDAGPFDTPAQYYAKLRAGSMDFLLVQFGLSTFTYDSQTDKYFQRSYNFYVFPKPLNRHAPDCRFMCQTSSIAFLANQDFDFNKLFKYGIPYLSANEEEKLVKRLEEKQKIKEEYNQALIPISDNDKPQIEEICSRIEDFLASDAEEITIDKCNAFMRRLVYQEAKIRWPNKVRVESKVENTWHCLSIQKAGTKEEEEEKENQKREKEKLEIKQAVGFSSLLKKIVESEKIIVGHNMLLDLCHIVHQFFTPLPNDYIEFKILIHNLFPSLLDTKVICQSQQFKEHVTSSNLNVLLDIMSKSPFSIPDVEPVEGYSYSVSTEKSHEAGYDAYITGLCFIALSNYLGTLQKSKNATVLVDSPLLNPFLNKLPIARLKDFPYVNLVGKDPNPSRDHVFHITFPKEWKHTDISQLFSPFGGGYISWLSDTSAYIGLYRRDQASVVMQALAKQTICKIQKYSNHQASLQTDVSLEDRKRKLSSPENTAVKGNGKSTTNGANTSEDGWQVATGKRRKKRKDQAAGGAANKKAFAEDNSWN